jgi:transposase
MKDKIIRERIAKKKEKNINTEMKVSNLDHLGIVAGVIDEIGIVEEINKIIGISPREKVSAGIIVKAMILNGLGFVSAPLYMFSKFFEGKCTEHLLGEGITAAQINDDRLGNVLDDLHRIGLSSTFMGISLKAVEKYKIKLETGHLDSTSFHVDGEYNNQEEGSIEITHGYSRDHRPDLKQFMMNLICVGDGDIPVMMEVVSGNQADKARFAELLQEFKEQWTFEGICVADSALYSEENLKAMTGLKWLTRVPLTIKAASQLVETTKELQASQWKGYATTEARSEYGGVSQRWILVESQARRKSDIKKLDKKIEQIQQNCHQQLKTLAGQDFACVADALAAAEKLSTKMKWHQLTNIQTVEKPHYEKQGKPKLDAIPSRISYRITAMVMPIEAEISAQRVRCGRFILATNILDSVQFTADDALREYKAQQGTERGFRFLKDPLFFTSSVFLKSAKRIEALGMIMALCLLVYNLAQRQLRMALALNQETIPNQLGKPTNSPTLRWVFQCFMAVHLVSFQGLTQVVNLSPARLHILSFFSLACQRYYLLPAPVS